MSRYDSSRCTPVRDWPERDRQLWEKALAPADPFEPDVGYARRWKETTRGGIENGYGRWLGWLERTGQLDPAQSPGDRASAARVSDYLAALRQVGSADNTCANRLQQLCNVLRAIAPEEDWSWIHRASSRIQSRAVLVRDPAERMQSADDVLQLGRDLMHAAEHDRFRTSSDRGVLYRDGLIIALLVRRPFRMANFSALTLGQSLQAQGSAWRIHFNGAATKNGEAIDCAWPQELVESLRTYLDTHRKVLLHSAAVRDGVRALWVARGGTPMGAAAIDAQIRDRTQETFGRSINPHTFRHIAATTIATFNPDGALDTRSVLSHASIRTSEKHYNRAKMLGASQAYQHVIADLRSSIDQRSRGAK